MNEVSTTQSFVPIKEIRDGIIIREDGVLCAVLLVSSMNFELKSEVERKAILFQFQQTLNSLEVETQILIQSRRLNIRPYLEFLEGVYNKQDVELLKLQTREYMNFIKEFTDSHDIMNKRFFIIVEYSDLDLASGIKGLLGKDKRTTQQLQEKFEETRAQLIQRAEFVRNNIKALGLPVLFLNTEEIIELLYQTFNPGDTQTPPQVN